MSIARRALVLLPLLALLVPPAQASIPKPATNVPIGMKVGGQFTFKALNAGGCHFNYTASVMDDTILSIDEPSGTNVTGASVEVTALKAGSTFFMLETSGGMNPCPPAMHMWSVTVEPDLKGLNKEFGLLLKAEFKGYKTDFKLGFGDYTDANKALGVQYKNDEISDDELQDAFHLAGVSLRQSLTLSAGLRYTNVILGGSELLAANGYTSQAPLEFFAGGGGAFDKFQDDVCSLNSDFHDRFSKASGSAIKAFEKAGAPRFAQWNLLPPAFASGPIYADQMLYDPPQLLNGPFTLTLRPTTNEARDNGRLLVAGQASPLVKAPFNLSMTYLKDGSPPIVMEQSPTVTLGQWSTSFGSLNEGTWQLRTQFENDSNAIEMLLHVGSWHEDDD